MNYFYNHPVLLQMLKIRDEYDEYGTYDQDVEISRSNAQIGVNNGVCYFIVSDRDGSNDHSNFVLHPTTHELIVAKELDREQRNEYEFVVRYNYLLVL